jgi:hypothetical protein
VANALHKKEGLIYLLGLVLAFSFPASFVFQRDVDFPLTLITVGCVRCVVPFLLFSLVTWWAWTHLIKNRAAIKLGILWLGVLIGVISISIVYNKELTNFKEIILFRQHRQDFKDLVVSAAQLKCPQNQDGCLFVVDLPADTKAWIGQQSMLLWRDETGKVIVISVHSRRGANFTYFDNMQETPSFPHIGHYTANCHYQLSEHWYLCSLAYN